MDLNGSGLTVVEKKRKPDWNWYEEAEFEKPKTEEIHDDSAALESYFNKDTGKLEISNGASGWLRADMFYLSLEKMR